MNTEIKVGFSEGRQTWRVGGISQDVATLIHVLAALLFWSLLLGAVSVCYELWRLEHNWRLGIA